jgi:hypothetical protein
MKMSKEWSLWLALSLPVLMVVAIIGSIVVPKHFAPQPMVDFVYMSPVNNTLLSVHINNSGKLFKENTPDDATLKDYQRGLSNDMKPHLYYYDSKTRQSKEVSFEEVEKLRLDDRKQSSDGFTVVQGSFHEGPFGGGSQGQSMFLKGHWVSESIDLKGVNNVYDFQFIGWVK